MASVAGVQFGSAAAVESSGVGIAVSTGDVWAADASLEPVTSGAVAVDDEGGCGDSDGDASGALDHTAPTDAGAGAEAEGDDVALPAALAAEGAIDPTFLCAPPQLAVSIIAMADSATTPRQTGLATLGFPMAPFRFRARRD